MIDYLIFLSHDTIFRVLIQVMFNAVLENACSEQGARMSAMDSSSRNAGDMLDRLTLTYNRSLSLSLLLFLAKEETLWGFTCL